MNKFKIMEKKYPRLMITGNAGSSGKTFVSMGILLALRERGWKLGVFKKGPDYIDPAWLNWASGYPAHNLDTYLMGIETVKISFLKNGVNDGINIIEGNRGIFDGVDEDGTHSSAEMSKLLKIPIILIVNVTKMSRTVAAFILGCKVLDPDINIAGVILNKVGSKRQEMVIRKAIEKYCSVPVVGVIPKIKDPYLLPDRHLGLVTPEEHVSTDTVREKLTEISKEFIDVDKIEEIAMAAASLNIDANNNNISEVSEDLNSFRRVKIGYFFDSAFTFYYPENLQSLRDNGADLIPISALTDNALPELDALYIGGGFPETHSKALADNQSLLDSVKLNAERGLPIYAECGGLIYLSNRLTVNGKEFSLTGILPIDIEMNSEPAGHGYCKVLVDKPNPFFNIGTELSGHEFHYSSVAREINAETAFSVLRGTGSIKKRDGIIYKNVLASYTHLHALSTPEWAPSMVSAAEKYKSLKMEKILCVKGI
jgi:cobyrinic acid a,c-diamide synthase